jgi:hypothetical protein
MSGKKIKLDINSEDFRVREGNKVMLKKWPTLVKPVYKSKEEYQKLLEEQVAQLSALPKDLGCTRGVTCKFPRVSRKKAAPMSETLDLSVCGAMGGTR